MLILGIETTCDETGVAVVEDGTRVIDSIVSSSADLHRKFGGIVPEVAARQQIKFIIPAIRQITKIHKPGTINAIAVANGPGLIGSLLVGVETAKALSLAWGKKLVAVNHLVGHVYANWLTTDRPQHTQAPKFPLIALIASGAHTDLVLMREHNQFRHLGGTLDDAAGEAFDKVARVLGLGYPGGPEIERIAQNFSRTGTSSVRGRQMSNVPFESKLAQGEQFPRPMIDTNNFDFSFSGLKTAVVNRVNSLGRNLTDQERSAVAREFQNAVVDVLVKKTIKAAKRFEAKSIVLGGGVAANENLRQSLAAQASLLKITASFPAKGLSVDNGAMIAAAAFFTKNFTDPLKLYADSNLHFQVH